MSRIRIILLAILAVAIAAVCIRLGFWQLDRLEERRAENARLARGLRGASVPIEAVGADSSQSRAQRVDVRGTYDFDHEIALINRSRDGAPGVNILTPLRLPGRDTAVIVNRGWVYSPDGATIDLTRWGEPSNASGTAYVSWLHVAVGGVGDSGSLVDKPVDSGAGVPIGATAPGTPRRVSRLERDAIARLMPYPIAAYQLVLIEDAAGGADGGGDPGAGSPGPFGTQVVDSTRPIRIPLPALDEGPHKSYAGQWFAFAAISLIGTGAVLWKERHRRTRGTIVALHRER